MKPTTEEIVNNLIGCVFDIGPACDKCAATGELTCSCSAELMLIAADRLEELEAKQLRWIPVTERLPEEGQRVVIVAENGFMGIADYRSDTTSLAIKFLGAIVSNATHWMPLPEEPKEDANENAQG